MPFISSFLFSSVLIFFWIPSVTFFLPLYLSFPLFCLQSLCIYSCLQFLTFFQRFPATVFTLIYWAYLSYRHVVFLIASVTLFSTFLYLSSLLFCLQSLCIYSCSQFLTFFQRFPATVFTLIYWAYLSYRHFVFLIASVTLFSTFLYLSSPLFCLQSLCIYSCSQFLTFLQRFPATVLR